MAREPWWVGACHHRRLISTFLTAHVLDSCTLLPSVLVRTLQETLTNPSSHPTPPHPGREADGVAPNPPQALRGSHRGLASVQAPHPSIRPPTPSLKHGLGNQLSLAQETGSPSVS